MESTASFTTALKEARRQAKGKITKVHEEVMDRLFPTNGATKDEVLRKLHLKVRELYVQDLKKKTSTGPLRGLLKLGHMAVRNIDWSKVIWWLVKNLPTIIKFALPLLLL